VIYVRDVAHVRDGYPPQTNIVRRDGRRGVLMSVLKTGSASTLEIIRTIKQRLPGIRSQLPEASTSTWWAISRCSCAPPSPGWCARR